MTRDHKLSNVILRIDDHAAAHPGLYYRCVEGASASCDPVAGSLRIEGEVDFLTYVNACSACKWRRYAGIECVYLHIELEGAGALEVSGIAQGERAPRVLVERGLEPGAPAVLDVEVPATELDLVGFSVRSAAGSAVSIRRAHWYAKVDEAAINPVRLALATTTFKKEHYITANIALVKEGIAAEGAPIAGNFHMFVVDNGRTLDAAALSDATVTVIPNPNVGGSGGFARGMMAATEEPGAFTHVLVMDDDVRIMPESLIRTFNLLSLARGRYRDAFVNGAMLSLEDPARQFEDVSFVAASGAYARVKRDLHVDRLADVLENERIDVEVPQAYGAWWYSCIPVAAIERRGLPMPFFIRCDDVEFGVRNQATFMTMGGICVWHESFEGRFRASVDCYQYIRNFFAMIALDDCASEDLFILRIRRFVRQNLRDMDYAAAELVLDGFAGYLEGPEHLEHLDGSALMKANGARNERVLPVGELDPAVLAAAGVTAEVLSHANLEVAPSRFMKLWRSLPYDKHYLPDFLLSSTPGYVVKNGAATIEGSATRCRSLVCLDPTREKGAVRAMDRARFRAIRTRERELMRRWRAQGKAVRASWKARREHLASRAFWEAYLAERAADEA